LDAKKVSQSWICVRENQLEQKGWPGGEYPYGVFLPTTIKLTSPALRDREIVVLAMKPALAVSEGSKLKASRER